MAEIRIHRVTKIEVKKVNKGDSYLCRDIVIHSKKYDFELNDYITEETKLDLFLDNASASKLVYSKEVY
jgi:hypothetical protein